MNAIAKVETRQPRSVLVDMATRYGMEPAAFEATVRATCMKPDKNGRVPSREEFAAFLLVAKEYKLNPLTKEIYAYAAKGGGIVPIVSIDGWVNLINSHPALDGIEFVVDHDDKGALVSSTCRIYRKDRSRPIEVTEYLSECKRPTEPWQMQHRMLRHKSLIQCSRYAFGFSGIYDEDDGAKIADMREVNPQERPAPPKPPVPPSDIIDAETGEVIDEREIVIESGEATDAVAASIDADAVQAADGDMVDDNTFFEQLEEALAVAGDAATVEEVWTEFDPMARFDGKPNGEINQGIAVAIKKRAEKRVGGGK